MHEGMNDVVKFGKFTIYLTEADVTNHYLKIMICGLCDEMFSYKQNLDEHMNSIHGGKHHHSFPVCPKVFSKDLQMKNHVRKVHKDPSYV